MLQHMYVTTSAAFSARGITVSKTSETQRLSFSMAYSNKDMSAAASAMKRWTSFKLNPDDNEVCKAFLTLQLDQPKKRVTPRRLSNYLDSSVRSQTHTSGSQIPFYVVQKSKVPNGPDPSWSHSILTFEQISKYDTVGADWNWDSEWIVDKNAPRNVFGTEVRRL